MANPDASRAAAVEAARHAAAAGMTLLDLARLLDQPVWLTADDIEIVRVVAGKIPVQLDPADTVLVVRLPATPETPPWALYLRIEGDLDGADFLGVMHHADPADPCADRAIRQLAWTPSA